MTKNSLMIGEVDRISGSGNAMFQAGGSEHNLGPLPEETVDKPVVAVPISSTWAVCLTPYISIEEYLTEFISTAQISRDEIERTIQEAAPPGEHYFSGELPSKPERDLTPGQEVDVEIVAGGRENSYALFPDGTGIKIAAPFLPIGHQTTVEIVDSESSIHSAKLADSVLENAPAPGENANVKVIGRNNSTAYGIHDSVPVALPDCSAALGDFVHAAVTEQSSIGVEATVAALPEAERLSTGDSFEVELAISPYNDGQTIRHDGIPVQVSPPLLEINGQVPVKVTDVESNTVKAEVDFTSQSGSEFETGQELSLSEVEKRHNQLVGKYEGVPLVIPFAEKPPKTPESLEVVINSISPGKISATIEGHSRLGGLESSDTIIATIDEERKEHLVGDYRGFPVWVPFDGGPVPSKLTVAVTQVMEYGIFASVAALSEAAIPDSGEVIPAEIENTYTSDATAWLDTTDGVGQYAVPIRLPLQSEFNGKVGVEVAEKRDSHLVGVLRTSTVGDAAEKVAPYLLETQRALLATRQGQLADAVSAWGAAAQQTNSELRRVEAERAATYGKIENSLRGEIDIDPESLRQDFETDVSKSEIPPQYQGLVEQELGALEKLIKAVQEGAPSSATDLQKIAYNVSSRSQVVDASLQLPRSSTKVDENWEPVFPHPFLLKRIEILSEEFETVPEKTARLLEDFNGLEEMIWAIAPAPSEEVKPTETVDVEPITPDLSTLDEESKEQESEHEAAEIDSTTSRENSAKDDRKPETHAQQTAESDGVVDKKRGPSDESTTESGSTTEGSEKRDLSTVTEGESPEEEASYVVDVEEPMTSSSSEKLRKLRQNAEAAASENPVRETDKPTMGSKYQRAQPIREFVKERADGICEGCGKAAPFEDSSGDPYLEVHHVDELGQGGEDHPSKVVALCPTCHKRVHYGKNGGQLNKELRKKLNNGLAEVGMK